MRFWKLCPICLTNRIYRPEVKTCGSKICVGSWRILSMEERGMALERAEELHDETVRVEREAIDFNLNQTRIRSIERASGDLRILSPEELAKIAGPQTQSPPSVPEKEVMTDEEFLSKHVPGYLDKDKKD